MAIVLTREGIRPISNHLKSNGSKVVFTHGAFDLFHAGHSEFLRESKKLGDYLIVGVESDKRLNVYKGSGRPVIPLKYRIKVLDRHMDIDFIIPIENNLQVDQEFYNKLYIEINPSIVTIGRDFFAEDSLLQDADKFDEIEIKKILTSVGSNQSTSLIIEKIRSQS